MEALVVKTNKLPLVISILVGVPVYGLDSELFLEGIEGAIKLNFLDGSSYQGQVEDCPIKTNCMQGTGVYIKADSIYMGQFKNNKPYGEGFFIYEDGQSYKGGFKDGELHGKGVMTYPDGRHYEGEYKNSKRNGYGVMTYQDGGKYSEASRYEGDWVDDKRNGLGVMIYPNDSRRLEGQFKGDVFIGN